MAGPVAHGRKIFGIGLSRTGTLSLTRGLRLLGFDARHYPDDPATRRELMAGQYELTLLDEADALLDIPVAPFFAQFDRAYPGSKFILTTRPTDAWLASVENHFRMFLHRKHDSYGKFVHASAYGALRFNAERFAYAKEAHEANVRRYFALRPDDLLELDISSGGDPWEPLCRFLDCSRPIAPFPHANKALSVPRSSSRELYRRIRRRARDLVAHLRDLR
jgi:hypothetical protein